MDGIQFALCNDCHKAPHVYCDNKAHYSDYEELEITDTQGNCTRVVKPFAVGASISCDGCSGKLGSVFFRMLDSLLFGSDILTLMQIAAFVTMISSISA